MGEFLGSLRHISHFLFFELIYTGETVYFRLQFPSDYKNQVFQNLELYFPGIAAIVDEPPRPPMRFHTNWISKEQTYTSIKRLRDF